MCARVVEHSRNFGSFAAIQTGMALARGSYIAVMAADLQEPPELLIEFLRRLAGGQVDVVAGQRVTREDRGAWLSNVYWSLYRRFVLPEIPPAGVDVFACSAPVRDVICSLEAVHTSLVAQLFWVGFRRELGSLRSTSAPRQERLDVATQASLSIRQRLCLHRHAGPGLVDHGCVGTRPWSGSRSLGPHRSSAGYDHRSGLCSDGLGHRVLRKLLNLIGLGIIGSYVWRAYDTVKGRPGAIVQSVVDMRDEQVHG